MNKLPKRDLKIIMGDMDVKVAADNIDRKLMMDKNSIEPRKQERRTLHRVLHLQ